MIATIAAGVATDAAGNQNAASTSTDNTVIYDATPPTVQSITRADADPTAAAGVRFTVTFSEPVTGVDAADFVLTTTGSISGASVTGVSGSGATYVVTVNTGTGSGTIRLDVTDNDSIRDVADNPLGGAGAGNGNFTGGQAYTVNRQPGTIQFSAAAYNAAESAGAATVTVTRTGGSFGAVSATFNTSDGAATAGSDYTAVTNFAVTLADGDAAPKTVTIPVTNDSLNEPEETVNLALSGVTGGATLGSPATATLTITDGDPAGGGVGFSSDTYQAAEGCVAVQITVTRTGDTSRAATVDFATQDVTATERGDYTTALGTLRFLTGETTKVITILLSADSYAEGTEMLTITLSNPAGGAVTGSPSSATLLINDAPGAPAQGNPVDDAGVFVCQQYHDFLNRQPDPEGQAFWTNQITECDRRPTADERARCRDERRNNVSAAFFLSAEFQERGHLVYRMYRASFPESAGRPRGMPRYLEFLRDAQAIRDMRQTGTTGVVFGVGDWQRQLAENQQSFAQEFVSRPEFAALYPETMSPEDYVDALNRNTGGALSPAERDSLVGGLRSGAETRATALQKVVEDAEFRAQEFRPAFVLLEYFGYLRKNADDPPDASLAGYDFWLGKLNQFDGDYIRSEMIRAFIVSGEYRSRIVQ